MRKWNLKYGDPLNLVLAADARLCQPSYTNDQIWEIIPSGGDPPSFLLQSTLGLRCRWMRLFPRFSYRNQIFSDPADYRRPPALTSFFPNYLAFSFSPCAEIDAMLEYRAVDSQTVAGKIRLTNHALSTEALRLEWCALLNPLADGQTMIPYERGSLYGQSGGVYAVFFVSGNPEPGASSLPGLIHDLELFPGNERAFTWGFSAQSASSSAHESARQAAACSWEAEVARIELTNARQTIEITTGRPDWDAALSLSQKTGLSLIFPGNQHLPHPSFVLSRLPDHGFSSRGDGNDYTHLWNGQTPQDLYYLANILLPGNLEGVEGMLQNFLETQEQNGFIDLKPGLAGQRTRRLAPPLLATLAVQIYQHNANIEWLSRLFPALLKFFNLWFTIEHDRDGDGFPEWDHPIQAGLEDAPIYDRWHENAQGLDISTLESPSLVALLYREAKSLIQIVRLTGHTEAVDPITKKMENLKRELSKSWDSSQGVFHYRDYQTHQSHKSIPWISFKGSGTYRSKRALQAPQRLVIHIRCKEQVTRPVAITIHGQNDKGEIHETLPASHFTWANGIARTTTASLYKKISKVEVQGLGEDDQGQILTADLSMQDISLFLPLWAGLATKKQAAEMVKKAFTQNFLQPFGVPLIPVRGKEIVEPYLLNTYLVWNLFLAEGLMNYGYHSEAANLVSRILDAIVATLKKSQTFREHFNAQDSLPSGERNHLRGLAPVGLFLKVLGVKIISEKEIILSGINPFPWPITVKYRGTSITRHQKDSVVTFLSGQTISVKGPKIQRVALAENSTLERRI